MVITKIDWRDENKFSTEKWIWFECLCDFNIPIGHLDWYDQHRNQNRAWECEKGDIFAISYGEYQDTDKQIKICLWGVYKGELQPCPSLTPGFIEINEIRKGGKVFANVTLNIKRLQKLNQILT